MLAVARTADVLVISVLLDFSIMIRRRSLRVTYVSPFKANTSANWNAVSRQIWRGCHTSVDSGVLNQAPLKQSAVCSTCIIPALPVNTIRYDSGYLTCSKKLTGSQLSLPHGINRKLKCETKNKMMSVISPVRSRYREAVQ